MPRIQMSRGERASLEMILKRPCLFTDIPGEHAEKLMNYGLIKREVMLVHATPRGQVENPFGSVLGESTMARR